MRNRKVDLSIIVCNYNKPEEQLIECMDSIKQQTIDPLEVILVDDCSDNPHAHAMATSIILPKNVGVAKARDIGVKMSRGKLLLFVDADDKLAPDYIQQMTKQIVKADIAYPNVLMFDYVAKNTLREAPGRLSAKHLLDKTCEIPVTSMMHRKVYEALNGFKEMPMYEDWEFWIRAMAEGFTFRKANTILWYRQNKKSRNKATIEEKTKIYTQMTAPYEVRGGKIWVKRG